MTGTRFARTGRCRFFVCLAVLTAMLCMVAIFHSSQQQLDETREQRLRCERQQEQLNEQLQNMVEQKYNQQKTLEQERNEQMESRHNLEQKLKELTILRTNEQMDIHLRYDKLQQAHKLLKSEHNELVTECQKSKKELMESTNALEKKLQSVRSEVDKEKNVLNGEITLWREKYNSIVAEKVRLEILLNASSKKTELQSKVINLENIIAQYEQHCDYKPETKSNNEKPLNPPNTLRNTSPRTRIEKSFNEQVPVSAGLYHIDIKLTNKTEEVASTNTNQTISPTNKTIDSNSNATNVEHKENDNENVILKAGSDIVAGGVGLDGAGGFLPYLSRSNRSLILNSVENFQILPKPIEKVADGGESDGKVLNQLRQPPSNQSDASANNKLILPLSAPRKAATTEASKSEQHVLEVNAPIKEINNTSTTSSAFPPLPMPPNPRKLPENVAPIPANFEELLKEDNANLKADLAKEADVNAAEEVQKHGNDGAKNNRYANAINEMEPKASNKENVIAAANAANEDSGAHEIKDNEFINDQNFNLPANEENNFFDGGVKNEPAGNVEDKPQGDDNDDDEGLVGAVDAGDIAVKNHNLLDTNNLNNEVAGDQGKEFPDELRLEENNEEDEDEDDYSNPGARQQGEQAIRN
ncbi:PREDICTED: putative leucine-rich repeat-containing protein DDB_G0290503 isoform X1 [Bactrocera latifrons]|uniref:putative leucine-rich repeat-containing protein DDB_G0290503 isoform X1 n=1 Tax=Bactrocera latifrons TaxID=174628 RepID=UPI0008DE9A11|nr:PREDICTED: putative leucine-rich repeat-containing protein DDB_G0290503 isoform X1 [Bactrocera latifrons]